MKPCLLCGKDTEGSVGAAGIKWPNICQPCKDSEDEIVRIQVKSLTRLFDQVLDKKKLGA